MRSTWGRRPVPGAVRGLSPREVEAHWMAEDALVLDIRDLPARTTDGHIARSVHVPRPMLELAAAPTSPCRLLELDPETLTIVVDESGTEACDAGEHLHRLGHRQVAWLVGGLVAWRHACLPVAGHAPWHVDRLTLSPHDHWRDTP
jgi:rhodanese-related sulfurtransferase